MGGTETVRGGKVVAISKKHVLGVVMCTLILHLAFIAFVHGEAHSYAVNIV